jgi:transposase
VDDKNLWRGQLYIELESLMEAESHVAAINSKLEILAKADKRVAQLESIPGVGPRLAEIIVATIDDPTRFKNAKQVGAYAGLVPRQYESGSMQHSGRISGQGNKLLRALLIEVSWVMLRYNSHMQIIFGQLCHGSKIRRKIAIVAAARRLFVWCWAMLRDGTTWQPASIATGEK